MKLTLRRCRDCGALGMGPSAVKLIPFEGRLYCAKDWRERLEWDEQRQRVLITIENEYNFLTAKVLPTLPKVKRLWEPYIRDLCALAEFGLVHNDKKIFVHWFARAVLAWGLRESAGGK